jgi:hypothetical protein
LELRDVTVELTVLHGVFYKENKNMLYSGSVLSCVVTQPLDSFFIPRGRFSVKIWENLKLNVLLTLHHQ